MLQAANVQTGGLPCMASPAPAHLLSRSRSGCRMTSSDLCSSWAVSSLSLQANKQQPGVTSRVGRLMGTGPAHDQTRVRNTRRRSTKNPQLPCRPAGHQCAPPLTDASSERLDLAAQCGPGV